MPILNNMMLLGGGGGGGGGEGGMDKDISPKIMHISYILCTMATNAKNDLNGRNGYL